MDLSMLVKIVNAARFCDNDGKTYTRDPNLIIFLKKSGGTVTSNWAQQHSGWLTEIRVGSVTFVHVSQEKLIE